MVNHGLAAKLTATDLLLLRSLGRLFPYRKFTSSLSAVSLLIIIAKSVIPSLVPFGTLP